MTDSPEIHLDSMDLRQLADLSNKIFITFGCGLPISTDFQVEAAPGLRLLREMSESVPSHFSDIIREVVEDLRSSEGHLSVEDVQERAIRKFMRPLMCVYFLYLATDWKDSSLVSKTPNDTGKAILSGSFKYSGGKVRHRHRLYLWALTYQAVLWTAANASAIYLSFKRSILQQRRLSREKLMVSKGTRLMRKLSYCKIGLQSSPTKQRPRRR